MPHGRISNTLHCTQEPVYNWKHLVCTLEYVLYVLVNTSVAAQLLSYLAYLISCCAAFLHDV